VAKVGSSKYLSLLKSAKYKVFWEFENQRFSNREKDSRKIAGGVQQKKDKIIELRREEKKFRRKIKDFSHILLRRERLSES